SYSALKGWGSKLFRDFRPSSSSAPNSPHGGSVPTLAQPTPRIPSEGARYTPRTLEQSSPEQQQHSRTTSISGPSARHARSRSPLPPSYSPNEVGFTPSTSPGNGTTSIGKRRTGGPISPSASQPQSPVVLQSKGDAFGGRGSPGELEDEVGNGGSSDEWDGVEGGVEEEVDRLLRELEPDVKGRD
ncbi:hypothetical protein P7C70_g6702, partial [Phenoliferia sp. Uapishka_3]